MHTLSTAMTMLPGVPGKLRALNSLREEHAAILASALAGGEGAWSLERHEGCDGDLILVLMPEEGEACLIVSRSSAGFHLGRMENDDYCDLALFGALEDLVVAARSVIQGAGSNSARVERTGQAGKKGVLF